MSWTGQQRPSRKERREAARAARRALEAKASQQELRRRRLIQLGGAAAVAAIVIAVVVALASSNGGRAPKPKSAEAKQERAEMVALLSGIPQSGNVLGNPKAPVTLRYFGDLECPVCREFTLGALPAVIEKFVRTGKLEIVYNAMSTATGTAEGEGAEPSGIFDSQQIAGLAAGRQNLMWHFVELFYHEQGEEDSGYVTSAFIRGIAEQVPGLDIAKWEEQRHNPELAAELEKDREVASQAGFRGTPSFLLSKTGGPYHKITELTEEQLTNASALMEPEINKLLKS